MHALCARAHRRTGDKRVAFVDMHTFVEERPEHERAIELLAEESHVPIHVITPLYKAEWAKLAIGARITAYISILTMRNVRRLLRQRSNAVVSATAA